MPQRLLDSGAAGVLCRWGTGLAAFGLCCLWTAAFAAERPSSATILRRADLVRNPYVGTSLEVELSVASRSSGQELRRSRSIMLTHRRDRTLMVVLPDDRTAPGALLIADDTYWLLLPQAERPLEMGLRNVASGDLSHPGFLRVNLRVRFEPRYDGEETLDGVLCWRLELVATDSGSLPFQRVRYWVAQGGFLPIRIEFLSGSGEVLKTARFTSYQETGSGLRPARIEIEDTQRPEEMTTLTLGKPRGVSTAKLNFDLADLKQVRAAAQKLVVDGKAPLTGKQLVEALRLATRVEENREGGP